MIGLKVLCLLNYIAYQVSEVDDAKDEETAIIDATNDLKILEKSKQISEGDAKSEQTSEGDVRYEKTSGEDVKNEKGSGGGVMSEQASGAGGDGDVTNKDAIDESDGEIGLVTINLNYFFS